MTTKIIRTTYSNRAAKQLRTGQFDRRTMRVSEAAAYVGICATKLRHLAWNGDIPFIQERKGCLMLFEKGDLDRWLDAHKTCF